VQIKSRVTILFSLIIAMLVTAFAGVLAQRETQLANAFNRTSLRHHQIIWQKIAVAYRAELVKVSQELVTDPAFSRAVERHDMAALAELASKLSAKIPGTRLEVYTPSRTLLYTSSLGHAYNRALLNAGSLQFLFSSEQALTGMTQTSATQFYWLYAFKVGGGGGKLPYALAVSLEVAAALNELKNSLDSETYLINLKGRLAQGTNTPLLEKIGSDITDRNDGISTVEIQQKTYRLTRIGQVDTEGRPIGFLLSLHDISVEANARKIANAWLIAWLACAVLFALTYVFLYLRRSFQPLNQSLLVLADLAKGDTRVQISDEIDDSGKDETARLSLSVSLLREDMLTFEMLREERHRAGLQQERIIKDQLKILADNLDAQARDEVIGQLEAPSEPGNPSRNQLAVLAATLGRLTSLISSQQKRLLQLLHEVHEAAESKARLAGLQHELDIARKMQLAILPRTAPDRCEFDFYDYFMLDEEHLALVVADVSGKGVAAAFFMAISRTLLKANSKFLRDPQACITELNELLCVDNDQMMFVTLFYGILNLRSGEFKFVNAGHNPPVIMRPGQSPHYLPPSPSMVLAVLEGTEFPVQQMQLSPGDTVVLYTDGVTEAMDAGGTLYGDARLLSTLGNMAVALDVKSITADLIQDVRVFENGAPQADDITCVVVRFEQSMY
jgi:sigma-B regulation protein RsbU (phosphoserine phosphatase)